MNAWVRVIAAGPLLGFLGACLPVLAPGIRVVDHHEGLTARTTNDTCMGCHEAEQEVLESMQAMAPGAREKAVHARMEGEGASLVAQWMLDDPRSCASCHTPRGVR